MPISKALRVGKFIITSEDIAPGAVTFADIGTIYSSNITENSNLFFSNARATAAVEASLLANLNIAGNLVVDSNVLYIDSVNNRVGVGTTAPTRLFTVQTDNPSGSATLGVRNQSSGTGAFATITTEALGTTSYFYTFGSGYTSSGSYLANSSLIETNGTNGLGLSAVSANTNASIRFYTNQTERLRLDTAGNLGLGVTPSAWQQNFKAYEIAGVGAAVTSNGSNRIEIGTGAYVGASAYLYTVTGTAISRYSQQSGVHYWFTAPSGTAGNAVTFTQAMTLNASGNLGLGTTSPYSRLGISGDITLGLGPAPNGSYGKLSWRYGNSSSFGAAGYIDVLQVAAGNSGHMVFATNNNSPDTAEPTERVRITSSGNLGIGTTSPNYLLDITASTKSFRNIASNPAGAGITPGYLESRHEGFILGGSGSIYITKESAATKWSVRFIGTFENNYEGGGLRALALNCVVNHESPSVYVGSTSLTVYRDGSTGQLYVQNNNGTYSVTFTGRIEVISSPQSYLPYHSASEDAINLRGANGTSNNMTGGLILSTPCYQEFHYTWGGQANHTTTLVCGSYAAFEIIYTAHQTNSGTDNNEYVRGKWSNNHDSHIWTEFEHSGNIDAMTTTFTVSQDTVFNSGKLVIQENYAGGSYSKSNLIVRVLYGSFSISHT